MNGDNRLIDVGGPEDNYDENFSYSVKIDECDIVIVACCGYAYRFIADYGVVGETGSMIWCGETAGLLHVALREHPSGEAIELNPTFDCIFCSKPINKKVSDATMSAYRLGGWGAVVEVPDHEDCLDE